MEKNDVLWKIARKRAKFKREIAKYLIINAFLCIIWFVTGVDKYFWPKWVMFGWGIGLVFQGLSAYGAFDVSEYEIEQEYQKLLDEQNKTK